MESTFSTFWTDAGIFEKEPRISPVAIHDSFYHLLFLEIVDKAFCLDGA
jgi:hypothetical protein